MANNIHNMALPLIFIYIIRLLKKQLYHSFVFNRYSSSHGGVAVMVTINSSNYFIWF